MSGRIVTDFSHQNLHFAFLLFSLSKNGPFQSCIFKANTILLCTALKTDVNLDLFSVINQKNLPSRIAEYSPSLFTPSQLLDLVDDKNIFDLVVHQQFER